MLLKNLKQNPDNPRKDLTDRELQKLATSIERFPKMMESQWIVVDEDGLVLSGNQRLRAMQFLGMEEIPGSWIRIARGWTPAMKKEFVIKANTHYGEWDWDILADRFPLEAVREWGVPVPDFPTEESEIPPMQEFTEEIADDVNILTCPQCGTDFVK